jgi:hypothetical protein
MTTAELRIFEMAIENMPQNQYLEGSLKIEEALTT